MLLEIWSWLKPAEETNSVRADYYERPPVPPGHSFGDVWGNGAEVWNEFTVHQCLGPTAMAYAALYGPECLESNEPGKETKPRVP
jgi:hypothetical protein